MVVPDAQGQGREDPAPLTEERMKKPMNNTFDDLTVDLIRLQQWMEEADAEEDQGLADTLAMVEQDFEDKADSYGKVIRNLETHAAVIKAEEDKLDENKKNLAAYRKTIERNIDRLEAHILRNLELTGKTNLKTDLFRFGTRKSSSVVVTAQSVFDIPDDFLRYKEPEPDKTAIKEYLKDNPECEWAHMETKVSLSLR